MLSPLSERPLWDWRGVRRATIPRGARPPMNSQQRCTRLPPLINASLVEDMFCSIFPSFCMTCSTYLFCSRFHCLPCHRHALFTVSTNFSRSLPRSMICVLSWATSVLDSITTPAFLRQRRDGSALYGMASVS
jgi:hypothetical protein